MNVQKKRSLVAARGRCLFPGYEPGRKEIDMKSIALNDAEITLIVWGLAGGLLGLLSVLLAMVVLQ